MGRYLFIIYNIAFRMSFITKLNEQKYFPVTNGLYFLVNRSMVPGQISKLYYVNLNNPVGSNPRLCNWYLLLLL
jgi:hypothetical protein